MNIDELKRLALAATPQDIDNAEIIDHAEDGGQVIECPICGGDGYAVLEGEYCNYDSKAIGVQFYGIGVEHGAAEAYFRSANPATVLDLLDQIEREKSARKEAQLNEQFAIEARNRAAYDARKLLAALKTVVSNAPDPYCAITRAVDAKCRNAIANAEQKGGV